MCELPRRLLRGFDEAFVRPWHVHRPDDPAFGTRKRATFWGARRVAKRTGGTRIYQPREMSHRAADRGWSERANGYIRRCGMCDYPTDPLPGPCWDCGRSEASLQTETGYIPPPAAPDCGEGGGRP